MKRIISVLLILALAFSMSVAAFAAGATVDFTVTVDPATKQVTIAGSISSGVGKTIAITVQNPSGGMDYMNQITSGVSGSFSCSYYLDEDTDGVYTVKVKGEDAEMATKTFTYTEQGGVVPPVTVDPQPVQADIDPDTNLVRVYGNAENGANKSVTVKVASASKIVYIDQQTTAQNGSYSFEFDLSSEADGKYTVVVSGSAFNAQQTTTFVKGAEQEVQYDVNGDGVTDLGDVAEMLKYFNWSAEADYNTFHCGCVSNCYHEYDGVEGLSWADARHADVNGDGMVDTSDLTVLLSAIE